ncbi:MAG: SRPBCC family protein [Candidatus Dormibacteria bacterium]|jgi:hypothetical protein
MARFVTSLASGWTPERAFAYMSDFSNAREWDPSVVAARSLAPGGPRLGSAYELTVAMGGGRRLTLRYLISELGPGAVELLAESRWLRSRDRITVAEESGGCRVTYDARLTLRGIARPLSPLLAPSFRRTATRALVSLRRILSQP